MDEVIQGMIRTKLDECQAQLNKTRLANKQLKCGTAPLLTECFHKEGKGLLCPIPNAFFCNYNPCGHCPVLFAYKNNLGAVSEEIRLDYYKRWENIYQRRINQLERAGAKQ